MRKLKRIALLCLVALTFVTSNGAGNDLPVVIRAGTMLDGRGHVLHNVDIVVENGKILRLETNPQASRHPAYDLSRTTGMPGWIDVHDHLTWPVRPHVRVQDKSDTHQQSALPT